jgi:LPS sulfotransferase NodH
MHRILGNARDDETYLDRVIAGATTPNGVFGAKVHWAHFLNLVAKTELPAMAPASPAERLHQYFPGLRYIHLVRRNAVARAISHYRAKKTDRWQRDWQSATDDASGEGEPGFDFDQIESFIRLGEAEDATWRQFFREHGIRPVELSYEELVADLEGTVRRVLTFLGISSENIKVTPPSLRKQADESSREWEVRYRRICAEESA